MASIYLDAIFISIRLIRYYCHPNVASLVCPPPLLEEMISFYLAVSDIMDTWRSMSFWSYFAKTSRSNNTLAEASI